MTSENQPVRDENMDMNEMYQQYNAEANSQQPVPQEHETQQQEQPVEPQVLNHGDITEDGGIVVETKAPEFLPNEVAQRVNTALSNMTAQADAVKMLAEQGKVIDPAKIVNANLTGNDVTPEASNIDTSQISGKDVSELDTVRKAFANKEVSPLGITDTTQPKPQYVPNQQKVEESQSSDVLGSTGGVIQFNVADGEASKIIASLSKEDRDKVEVSKTIVVNQIKKVDIPVATRKITSLDQWKTIAPLNNNHGNITRPLPNSGYAATFKEAGSLALASISPDADGQVDFKKRYEFCYKYMISTSIGKLTFDEFVKRTHPDDLAICIHAIIQASSPEQSPEKVELTCGSCGKPYPVEYIVGNLIDYEATNKELLERTVEIMKMATTVDDAKVYHEKMPIRNSMYAEISDTITLQITEMSGYTVIERGEALDEVSKQYNPLVSLIAVYIPKIFRKMKGPMDKEVETYEVVDTMAIADILYDMTNSQLAAIKELIGEINSVGQPVYSLRNVRCPHCGLENERIPITIDQLVFTKVREMIL